MFGLAHLVDWRGGDVRLSLHVSWTSLVIGAAGGIVTAIVCVAMSLALGGATQSACAS